MTNTVFAIGTGVFVVNSVAGAGKTSRRVQIGYLHPAANTTRLLSGLEEIRNGGLALQKVRVDDVVLQVGQQED